MVPQKSCDNSLAQRKHTIFETVFWLKRQSGKRETCYNERNAKNGETAKRETGDDRNGRDNHPEAARTCLAKGMVEGQEDMPSIVRMSPTETEGARKGTNGVSTNGVTANFMFFDWTFWVLPLNLLVSSQKCQGRTFFPNPAQKSND